MKRIYFDHSATTPVDERVAVLINEYMLEKFGNPSSLHSFGQEANAALEKARRSVASLINCKPEEIYFTSGGTEADNIALIGYALKHRDRGDHVIISSLEHPAIRNAASELERQGFNVSKIKADSYGEIHTEEVQAALTDKTILVSIMHVNNEIGTINNIGEIGRVCKDRGIAFHSDTVQSYGKVAIDVQAMGLDMASISGHKIYATKGIGALYMRSGVEIQPLSFGGHQENGIRVGTENMPGIVGIGKAADLCKAEMKAEGERLSQFRDLLYNRLIENLDDIRLNGHPIKRLPGNLNLTFQGVEGEALLMSLDMEGIGVSTGSACSSGSTQPSAVLTAIGLNPQEAQSSLRITLGRENTRQDIDYSARVIIDVANRLRKMAGRTVA